MKFPRRTVAVTQILGLVSSSAVGLLLTFAPSPALAKGPRKAVVSGPGLTHPVILKDKTPLIFFGSRPGRNALLDGRPDRPLGPRFTVTYPAIWGPHSGKVVEYVFPYARPRPVSYVPPHQRAYPLLRRSAWAAAHPGFARTFLEALGLPTTRAEHMPAARPRAAPIQRNSSIPLVALAGLAASLAFGVAVLVRQRRRRSARRLDIAS
jgi:hypothetical protein